MQYTSLVPMATTIDGAGQLLLVYNKYWCYGGDCPNEAKCMGCSTSHSVSFTIPITVSPRR